MLENLSEVDTGIMIGRNKFNSFAYADDISLFSVTVPGLQKMIDLCVKYSLRWKFRYNSEKSKCMIVGKHRFSKEPEWRMQGGILENVDKLEILGNVFNRAGSSSDHVAKRSQKCKQSFYSLSPAGMLYPGSGADVQSYLFKRICQPTLTYGLDCMTLSNSDLKKVDSEQGKLIKQSLGLSKRSHNSEVSVALNVKKVGDIVPRNRASLFHRILQVCRPSRALYMYFISVYVPMGVVT